MTFRKTAAPRSQCKSALRCDSKVGCFLGVDIDDAQLQKASENIEFAELRHRIHLLKASSMGEKHWRRCETLGFKSTFRLQRAADYGPLLSLLAHGIAGEHGLSCYMTVYIMTCLCVFLCVCSSASAQCQCRCCSVWPTVWQEVWLQNRHGFQPAAHPGWDGEVGAFFVINQYKY